LAEGFGLASIVAIITSYYASDYDLLMLVVPLLAMHTRRDAPKADRLTRYLETTGLLLLLLTPVYWFTRVYLQAECLMTLPLLALGIALARRLTRVRLEAGTERSTSMPVMDALG
jgi:cadmium resistance protein CadD (predicted permease)